MYGLGFASLKLSDPSLDVGFGCLYGCVNIAPI